jgi:hypothetical protein
VKLADGTFLVGDPGTGTPNVSHVDNEVVLSSLRWLKLDVPQTVTRGTWVEKPDLSKVDEIGWTQLMPGSGHGVRGFVSVSVRGLGQAHSANSHVGALSIGTARDGSIRAQCRIRVEPSGLASVLTIPTNIFCRTRNWGDAPQVDGVH